MSGSEGRPVRLAPGSQLGRFRILSTLGSGGVGDVYRAYDATLGREVALKLLRNPTPRAAARLQREGELTARLEHPGIVTVHGAGEVQGCPFLVYELVPGGKDFAAALPGMPRAERLRVIEEVAQALGVAHAQGIVHRDLKPANVLIRADGRAAVADLGLGWSAELERLTLTGALAGTPTCMAPEQVTGDSTALGPSTDVWALGVMLFEALTDRLPFEAGDLTQLLLAISRKDAPLPSQFAPDVPQALDAICARALQRDPARRYADASAFAAALRAGEERMPRRALPWKQLAGASVALALGAFALLPGGGASADASPASAEAPTPGEPAPPSLEQRAKAGDAQAMLELGLELAERSELELAEFWLEKALAAARWPAAAPLARLRFAYGDEEAALECLTLAAAHDEAVAVERLVEHLVEHGCLEVWRERAEGLAGGRALVPVALRLEPEDSRGALSLLNAATLLPATPSGEPRAGALELLADRYRDGLGVEPDEAQSAAFARWGAEDSFGPSMFRHAVNLRLGRGVTADLAESELWFRRAEARLREMAEAGDPRGMIHLGGMYANGFGVERDLEQTYRWYREAAGLGDVNGMNRLAVRLGKDGEHAAAIAWYRQAIAAGSAQAMCNLGKRLRDGNGIDADVAQAEALFRRAAEAGHPRGMFLLGELLARRDDPTAIEWVQRAARRGRADAMLRLGELLRDGASLPGESAQGWFERAAARRDTRAMVALAELIRARDVTAADGWYRRAAQAGDPAAMLGFARVLLAREGVEEQTRGVGWANQAAQRGEAAGYRLLGDACRDGRGVPTNLEQAREWYRRGAEAGDPEAQAALERLPAR